MTNRIFPYCVLLVTLGASPLLAQQATRPADMLVEPFQIAGNVYFVSPEAEHSSYLITTPDGHILINSGYERQLSTIRGSVEELGFDFTDIDIILGSHAHVDHQEGDAQIKALTGAQVMAMEQDVPALRNLTPGDKPHPIDRVLRDGDTVELGGVTLTALLTAGHTEGCTTYTMQTQDGGRTLDVVIGCGWGAGGRVLVNNADYPDKAGDYARTCMPTCSWVHMDTTTVFSTSCRSKVRGPIRLLTRRRFPTTWIHTRSSSRTSWPSRRRRRNNLQSALPAGR